LPEALRGAIDELRRTRSHEGRRRQLQFVGKQMRAVEAAPLAEQLAAWRLGSAEETLKLHEIERWRDELIADDAAVTRWAETHAGTDMQRLRSLVRAARKQAVASPEQRHGKAYRELFQYIKPWLAEAAEPESTDDEADDDTP
jgi:ribosome-associated protein